MKNTYRILVIFMTAIILFSCRKGNTLTQDAFPAAFQDARIRFSGDNGGIASIDINSDGSYVAEIEMEGPYQGIFKFLRTVFRRMSVGTESSTLTSAQRGTYTIEDASYVFDGLGHFSFESDGLYGALLTASGTHRPRTGMLSRESLPEGTVQAAGCWNVVQTTVKYSIPKKDVHQSHEWEGCPLETIASWMSENGVPDLARHSYLFEGWDLKSIDFTHMNGMIIDMEKQLFTGFWDLQEQEVKFNGNLDDEPLGITGRLTPIVSDAKMTIEGAFDIEKGKAEDPQKQVLSLEVRLVLKQ